MKEWTFGYNMDWLEANVYHPERYSASYNILIERGFSKSQIHFCHAYKIHCVNVYENCDPVDCKWEKVFRMLQKLDD